MNLIDKIKLVLTYRKPVCEIIEGGKDIKRGWKTLPFWVTFLGSILSALASFKGLIPPLIALFIVTGLTVVYNVLRGLLKAEEDGTRPTWKSTEVWMGVLGQVSSGLLALQAGGVTAPWLITASSAIALAMAFARDLSNLAPANSQTASPSQSDAAAS